MFKIKAIVLVFVIAAVGLFVYRDQRQTTVSQVKDSTSTASQAAQAAVSKAKQAVNHCGGNKLDKAVIVSIKAQHLWACQGTRLVHGNAVITGMELYPADLTPKGTYKITGKLTDQYLKGSDATGSWDDFVNYWMPFLYNQYGAYGFHDLTQTANGANGRADSDFGNIDINAPSTAAKHGSHGCVEMPLAAMRWLYDWAPAGTTVSIVG